ncbi:DNA-binding protein [Halobacteriales archaeon QS_3_64_16]|nr:MAG: DNA-binding protein [Halobacteriales archaeon QS_3_64_16]
MTNEPGSGDDTGRDDLVRADGSAAESETGGGADERTWEPRPVPEVTPETEAFWRGASEGRFLLSECQECGLIYHYPRALCPDCFGEDVTWREASGEGEIYSYSIARQASGWPDEALPLVVAYVELEEGPRVMTNVLDCEPEDVAVGTPVETRFVPTEKEDVSIPVFVPCDSRGRE